MRRLVPALLATAGLAAPLAAQTMRTYSATRPLAHEKSLVAIVEFGAGNVVIEPAREGLLYTTRLRYDADRFLPVQQFDLAASSVRLGLANTGGTGIKVTSKAQLAQTGLFEFSTEIPLSLTANLGASEAILELGGMTLRDLTVKSGASRTVVSFGRPTTGTCTTATFSLGATDLDVENLAQSGCRRIRVEGGMGTVLLNFDGTWRTNIDLDVELAMGTITLAIPRGTGVRVNAERFLSPMETNGFVRLGDAWVTPDLAKAKHVLQVRLKTTLAGITVRWR